MLRSTEARPSSSLGRKRLQCRRKGRSSHYLYSNFTYSETEGGRLDRRVERVIPLRRGDADLINCCWYNPASGSRTLHHLALDLDFKRADRQWVQDDEDALSWPLIAKHLREHHPELFKGISYVVSSKSGQGLHVFFPVSPMEFRASTEANQSLARTVQGYLIQLFTHYGLGADPSARGLNRDFANFHDVSRVVYRCENALYRAHAERERHCSLRLLFDYLNDLPYCGYIAKKGSPHFLYPDARAEVKFASLYVQVRDSWLESGDGLVFARFKDLVAHSGISELLVRKVLRGERVLSWLAIVEEETGIRLSFNPNHNSELGRRAEILLKGEKPAEARLDLSEELKRPECVEDGERNRWITHAALLLKWGGVEERRAEKLIQVFVSSIRGARSSRNCKQYRLIVRALYRNLPHTFARLSETSIPEWLLQPIRNTGSTRGVTKFQKGDGDEPLSKPEKILPFPAYGVAPEPVARQDSSLLRLEISRLICDLDNGLTKNQRCMLLTEAAAPNTDDAALASLLVLGRAWANVVLASDEDTGWTKEFAASLLSLGSALCADEKASIFERFKRSNEADKKAQLHKIKALARMRMDKDFMSAGHLKKNDKVGGALNVAMAMLDRARRKPQLPDCE